MYGIRFTRYLPGRHGPRGRSAREDRMAYLRLLGGASLEEAGSPLDGPVAQRHRLALLALLAAAYPRGVTRDKLLGYLWPEKDAGRARNLLSQAVHYVRRAAGRGAVVSPGGELLLGAEALPSDLVEFEAAVAAGRWTEAVELYGGPFLDGFHLRGAMAFEWWVDQERLRIADRYHEALEATAEGAEAEGDWLRAVTLWRRRAREEPFNSGAAHRLMEALAAAGNVPGALMHARKHERVLEKELGAALPEEVRALADTLAAGDDRPGLAAASAARPEL
jgi:DNA-binding SARP family transcriptional activator